MREEVLPTDQLGAWPQREHARSKTYSLVERHAHSTNGLSDDEKRTKRDVDITDIIYVRLLIFLTQ